MLVLFLVLILFSIAFISPQIFGIIYLSSKIKVIFESKVNRRYIAATFIPVIILFLTTNDYGIYRVVRVFGVVLCSVALSYLFFNNRRKTRLIYRIYIISSICFFLILKILNIAIESIPEFTISGLTVFSGSYHLFWWLGLILLFTVSVNKRRITQYEIFIFFVFSLITSGRSSIILGSLLFVIIFCININKSKFQKISLLIVSIIIGLGFLISSFVISNSKGLSERGIKLTARNFIYACYSENLTKSDLLFGFHPNNIAEDCLVALEREDGSSKIVMTESSLLSLISHHGFFGLFYLIYIISLSKNMNNTSKIILLFLLMRSLTGDFLFFTLFDFIFLAQARYDRL